MKIVSCHPSGEPIDPEYTKFNRFFNGTELLVFDDFFEYATYFDLLPKDESVDDGSIGDILNEPPQ